MGACKPYQYWTYTDVNVYVFKVGTKVSLIVGLQRFSFLHTQNYEFLGSVKLVLSLTDLFKKAPCSYRPQRLTVLCV